MNRKLYQVHFAKKRFGQNFLTDEFVIDQIISSIHPSPEQTLIEIGPGLGALTLPLADQMDKILVIELDRHLADRLNQHPQLKDKLILYQQDVMTVNFSELSATFKQPLRILGNLPYNISTPLLFHLFKDIHRIDDMHFMLQREVVNRLLAAPNTKAYGRLSVMVQYHCKVIPILEVPPDAFTPIPKVYSAMIRLLPYRSLSHPYPVTDIERLNLVTRQAFNQRRKTLHNSLGALFTDQELAETGICPKLRAENVSVEQYCLLANRLH